VNRRRPGHGRYAHREREQRWQADAVPGDAAPVSEITDRYLSGTSLRLRRVEGADGVVHKLTQKVRPVVGEPGLVLITTMYLPDDEVSALAGLPGHDLRKTRHHVHVDGRTVAVDRFHGALEGLVLAETELADDEERLPLPPFAVRDVTDDDRFAGGALARLSPAEVARLQR